MAKFKMPSGKSQPEPMKGPKPDRSTKDYAGVNLSMKNPKDMFRKKK